MSLDAIILAGGYGTRLQSVVKDLPKPMADVNGKPFLEYLLSSLKKSGIRRFVLSTGYKGETIKNHFGNNFKGIPIVYVEEKEALGTGGGIALAIKQAETENVLVLNGDTFFDVDISAIVKTHIDKKADATLCLRKVKDAGRFGTVNMNAEGKVISFKEKDEKIKEGLINGGIYVFRKDIFEGKKLPEKFSIEKDFFEKKVNDLSLIGFESTDYFIDIGIPEEYDRAQKELREIKIDKSWTLFLDRDGVINVNPVGDYVRQWKSFVFLQGVYEAMKTLNSLFKTIVVVTNQQGIGKGFFTEDDLNFTHGCMTDLIKQNGGRVDKIYFCSALASDNNPCRKPDTGMAREAQKDFPHIVFRRSIMVGDSITDMEFGRKLGMTTVLIKDILPKEEFHKIDFHFLSLQDLSSFLTAQNS